MGRINSSAAQEKKFVLVTSSAFAMSFVPTNELLLPECFRVVQLVTTNELQAAQSLQTRNDTIEYTINRTKIVFRDAFFNSVNKTSTVQFFAIATVSTAAVPDGSSFRDYRLRTAETREEALNELVSQIFQSSQSFVEKLHSEAANLINPGSSMMSTGAFLLLEIESVHVDRIEFNHTITPNASLTDLPLNNKRLTTTDAVLICVSLLILLSMIAVAVQLYRDHVANEDPDDTESADNEPTDAFWSPDHEKPKRVVSDRDIGEFKASDSASSSIASIIFTDYPLTSAIANKEAVRRTIVRAIDYANLPKNPSTMVNGPIVRVLGSFTPMDNCSGRIIELALQPNKLTDVPAYLSEDGMGDPASKTSTDNFNALSVSQPGCRPVSISFLNLVDTLLLNDPNDLASSSESTLIDCNKSDGSVAESRSEPFEMQFFNDDVSSATSAGLHIFRNLSQEDGLGNCKSKNAHLEKSSSTAAKNSSEAMSVLDWMKSIRVVSNSYDTVDSKTSVNTSFSSMTTPSGERSIPSPSRNSHHRANPEIEDEAEFVEV